VVLLLLLALVLILPVVEEQPRRQSTMHLAAGIHRAHIIIKNDAHPDTPITHMLLRCCLSPLSPAPPHPSLTSLGLWPRAERGL
jgi:hypothetical protein